MAIEARWYDERCMHMLVIYQEWQWSELQDALERSGELMRTVSNPVSYIHWIRDMPKGLGTPHLRLAMVTMPDQIQQAVIVVEHGKWFSAFARTLVGALSIFARGEDRIAFANSVDEAVTRSAM